MQNVLYSVFSPLAAIVREIEIFHPEKNPKSVESHFFDRFAPKFELSWHLWYLHEEFIPLVLFSPMIQEEEKECMRHRFRPFENAEATKRIGLPPDKSDFQLVPPQNTQILDLIRPA